MYHEGDVGWEDLLTYVQDVHTHTRNPMTDDHPTYLGLDTYLGAVCPINQGSISVPYLRRHFYPALTG